MPSTIKTLSTLFTKRTIEDTEEIHESTIYARLACFYQNHLIPVLTECVKNETDQWSVIANDTKEKAIKLINDLSQEKSSSELLQIIRFQRVLLGKEPYLFKWPDSLIVPSSNSITLAASQTDRGDQALTRNGFNALEKPLINFLSEIKKNQSTHFSFGTSSSSASHGDLQAFELRPHWVPYSILFEQLEKDDQLLLSKEESLEVLTALFIEEPQKFGDDALISSLDNLTNDEIVMLLQCKKPSPQDFQTVVEATFNRGRKLNKTDFINILSCQPQTFAYCHQNPDSIFNTYLTELTPEDIIDIFTQKETNHYGYSSYRYSEKEFYDAFTLIVKNNNEFIDRLSNNALIKLLSRLEFSTSQYEREKNQRNEDIFETIKNNQKILGFGDKDWRYLLTNANPTIIAKILSISTPKTESFFDPVVPTEAGLLISTIQKLTPTLFDEISDKMIDVIYPHFRLNDLTNEQKAKLITILAKNFTEKSVSDCEKIIADTNFSFDNIYFIVKNFSKYDNKSTHLIQTLFERHYEILYQKELKSLCELSIEVAIALFTHKNEDIKNHVFDQLTITDFAEITAIHSDQCDIKKLLEIVLEKIKREEIRFKAVTLADKGIESLSEEISKAFSILLNAENGAKNTDIFNFIYNNKTIRFTGEIKIGFTHEIKKEHLVKSLSYSLNSDDNKLKSNLVNITPFFLLQNEDIFQIFLDAQNNHSPLPSNVVQTLFIDIILKHNTEPLKELDRFLDKNKNNYSPEVIENTRCEFILEAHKASTKLFPQQTNNLVNYLQKNLPILLNIIIKHRHHDHLVTFLNDKKIASLLQLDHIVELFSIEEEKNVFFPVEIREKLASQLLKDHKNLVLLNNPNFIANQLNKNKNNIYIEKALAKLLITIYQQTYQKNISQRKKFISNLNVNTLAILVQYQSQNPQLIKLFQDPLLLTILNSERAYALLAANPLLPTPISKTLITHIFGQSAQSLEAIIPNENNPKMRLAFLLTAFLEDSIDGKKLIDHFSKNPHEIVAFLLYGVNQPNVNFNGANLLKLFQHPDIVKILTLPKNRACLITAFLNLAQSELNPENQLLIADVLIPFLSKKAVLEIFAALALNGGTLGIEVQKHLVEKLDFKRLNQLIESSRKEGKGNIFDLKTLKTALDNICFSQIQRQREFSIPAFVLSLLYGILYYPTLGWVLHFVAPKTNPAHLYKALRKCFQPVEIERINQKTFEKKAQLARIADSLLATTEEDIPLEPNLTITTNHPHEIIIENPIDDNPKLSLFNRETRELNPFYSEKENYIYLFPGEKERLNSKFQAIKKTVQTIEKEGGVFLTDKNKYFKDQEEKPVTLPEKEKQQLQQLLEESKKHSRQTYR